MNQWRKKIDSNHTKIVNGILKIPGCDVLDLNRVGGGCTDILVQRISKGEAKLYLMEIKTETGKLNPKQLDFHARFVCHVVRSMDDVYKVLGI